MSNGNQGITVLPPGQQGINMQQYFDAFEPSLPNLEPLEPVPVGPLNPLNPSDGREPGPVVPLTSEDLELLDRCWTPQASPTRPATIRIRRGPARWTQIATARARTLGSETARS